MSANKCFDVNLPIQLCPSICQWGSGSPLWGRSSQKTVLSGGREIMLQDQPPGKAPGSLWMWRFWPSDRPGEPGCSPLCFEWPSASSNWRRDLCRSHPLLRSQRGRLAAGLAGGWSSPCHRRLSCIASGSEACCFCWIWIRQTAWFRWMWMAVLEQWWQTAGRFMQCKAAGKNCFLNDGLRWADQCIIRYI